MRGLNEDTIRQITERVTREVLAALTREPGEDADTWPEWNEYVDENGVMEEAAYMAALSGQFDEHLTRPEPSPIPRHEAPEPAPRAPSRLREAARGNVPNAVVAMTEDGEDIISEPSGMVGQVIPITGFTDEYRGGGFNPHGNAEWFARERAKDAMLRRQPAWETVVRQA